MKTFKDFLNEMSFNYSKLEQIVTCLAEPIIDHLIKVLVFDDPRNRKKHIANINAWLHQIRKKPSSAKRKTLVKRYHRWIFTDWLRSVSSVSNIIEYELTEYHKLDRLRNAEEVYNIIIDASEAIASDIAMDKFTSIGDYIKELK